MFENASGFWKVLVPILWFPLLFQDRMISFAWGAQDEPMVWILKRALLLLPVLSIIFACWVTVFSALSFIVRPNRSIFLQKFFLTWLDLGKSILSFWGGVGKLLFYLVGWILGLVQMIVVGVVVMAMEVVLSPFRAFAGVGQSYLRPGIPWIAVIATFVWCMLESFIFMIVLTPLVTDVFSNLTGEVYSSIAIQIPLYFLLLAFVLGSYAVLSSWVDALKTKDYAKITQIGIFELFVLLFEIFFLYREFVDALVPWFAQHAGEGFELGIFGILSIASFAWLGIRGMSWFLFASHGTPTIMAIIRRTGLAADSNHGKSQPSERYVIGQTFLNQVKKELDWVHAKGDELLAAVVLPPIQILAASVNFLSLLVTSSHFFDLPFKNIHQLRDSKSLMEQARK